jgi:O-antigen/teichoic acid export membrane protein
MEAYSTYLRFWGYYDDKRLIQIVRRVLLVASILFSITVILFFDSVAYILFFAFLWVQERLYFFRAKVDIKTYGRIKILQNILITLFTTALIFSRLITYKNVLLAYGFSYLIVAIIYNIIGGKSTKYDVKSKPLVVKDIFKYSMPLSFNAVVVWLIGAADQVLINQYLDTMTLTNYSVAFRLLGVVRLATGVIMEYWPRFYIERIEKRQSIAIQKMRNLFCAYIIIISVGTALFSGVLYYIMGASSYSGTKWIYVALSIAEIFRIIGSINMTFLSYKNNTSINVICLSVISVTKFLINMLLIHSYGVEVLLLTTLIGYVVYFGLSIYFGRLPEKRFLVNEENKY